jgi:hypothetical protein
LAGHGCQSDDQLAYITFENQSVAYPADDVLDHTALALRDMQMGRDGRVMSLP